ncbi:hypothetical protein BGZ93_002926 [Podila epicladia]|nr:hypothetical protein BGZ92_004978 [Podila epicladia]KAG0080569.1 hypothetical protein BGZ93_002926 [Podila epicladia]
MTANIIGPGADREGYDYHSGNIILGGNSRPNPHRFRKSFLGHFMLALGIFTVLVVLQSRHGNHQPEKSQEIDSTGDVKDAPSVHESVSSNQAHDDILDSFTGSAAEYIKVNPGLPELPPEDELRITVSPHLSSSSSSSSQNRENIEQELDRLQRELDQSQVLVEQLQQLLDQQSVQLEEQQRQLSKNQGPILQQQQQEAELQTANSPDLLEQTELEDDDPVYPQETIDGETPLITSRLLRDVVFNSEELHEQI